MGKYNHNIFYYIWKGICDSKWLKLALSLGGVSFIFLVVYYAFPSFRFTVFWEKDRVDSINNLLITLSGGYLITYVFYFLTITIPIAIKTQHKRVALSDNAKYLEYITYVYLNALCEFCEKQDTINPENLDCFIERNCNACLKKELKENSKRFIQEIYINIKEIQMAIEKDLEFLYTRERQYLISLENAQMWKTMKRLMNGCLFTEEGYGDFLNHILYYRKQAICLSKEMEGDTYSLSPKMF